MLWLKVELIYGSKVGIFGRVFVFRSIFNNVLVQFRFLLFLFFNRASSETLNE